MTTGPANIDPADHGDSPDAVIVLGAAVVAPGVPGPALTRRLDHAVTVFRRDRARHLVVSGGVVGAPPAEATLMRQRALGLGVPDERIVVEDRARNTFENAVFSGRIVRERGWQRIVVVTDGFHLRRALFVFRTLGFAVSGEGVPRPNRMSRLGWYRAHLIETWSLARSAWLFAIGAHRSVVEREWEG
jgi:uncharacterized SAM-binding protein YcdF (DUF218 family)